MCGSEDHLQQDCPHNVECEDVGEDGVSRPLRACFNCGGRGHLPIHCEYVMARWRMGRNARNFFDALREGKDWTPTCPGPDSLKEMVRRSGDRKEMVVAPTSNVKKVSFNPATVKRGEAPKAKPKRTK